MACEQYPSLEPDMYDCLRRRAFEEHKSIAHVVRDIIAEARRRAEEPGCKRGQ